MRREITAHTRDPVLKVHLTELVVSCSLMLRVMRLQEVLYVYITYCMAASGEEKDWLFFPSQQHVPQGEPYGGGYGRHQDPVR
jgi:hypothetical protein